MTPEGKVKKRCKELLTEYGAYFFMPAANGYGRVGIPDIVGCFHGRFFAVECKAAGGKTTPLQDRELRSIERSKGVTFVINENNIEELQLWLASI